MGRARRAGAEGQGGAGRRVRGARRAGGGARARAPAARGAHGRAARRELAAVARGGRERARRAAAACCSSSARRASARAGILRGGARAVRALRRRGRRGSGSRAAACRTPRRCRTGRSRGCCASGWRTQTPRRTCAPARRSGSRRCSASEAGEQLPFVASVLGLPPDAGRARAAGRALPGGAAAADGRLGAVAGRARWRRAGPVAVAVDDLHWADSSSLALIEQLLRGRRPTRPSCSCSRPGRSAISPSWRCKEAAARELPHRFRELALERSAAKPTATCWRSWSGGGTLPAEVERQVLDARRGQSVLHPGAGPVARGRRALVPEDEGWRFDPEVAVELPDTVEKVVLARIDRLSPERRRRAGRGRGPGAPVRAAGAGGRRRADCDVPRRPARAAANGSGAGGRALAGARVPVCPLPDPGGRVREPAAARPAGASSPRRRGDRERVRRLPRRAVRPAGGPLGRGRRPGPGARVPRAGGGRGAADVRAGGGGRALRPGAGRGRATGSGRRRRDRLPAASRARTCSGWGPPSVRGRLPGSAGGGGVGRGPGNRDARAHRAGAIASYDELP